MTDSEIDRLDRLFVDGTMERDEYVHKLAMVGAQPLWDRAAEPQNQVSYAVTPHNARRNRVVFWAGIAVLAILVVLSGILNDSSSGSPERDTGDSAAAWVMCQRFVEDRLRAPATAEYPSPYSQYTKQVSASRNVFEVSAYVDSENGFGAFIRNDFVCRVRYEGDESWRLESLEFGE